VKKNWVLAILSRVQSKNAFNNLVACKTRHQFQGHIGILHYKRCIWMARKALVIIWSCISKSAKSSDVSIRAQRSRVRRQGSQPFSFTFCCVVEAERTAREAILPMPASLRQISTFLHSLCRPCYPVASTCTVVSRLAAFTLLLLTHGI
jgi:hypothetical protein